MSERRSSRPEDAQVEAADERAAHRPPRCFVENLPTEGGLATLSPEESHHVAVVLRLKPGALVEAFDGEGRYARGRVRSANDRMVSLELATSVMEPPTTWHGTLLQGAPKGDKKDEIVRAAVELGFHRVVFFASERTIGRPTAADCRRWSARWRATAIAAAKQCGRNRLPEVLWSGDLEAAVSASRDTDVSLVCDAGPGAEGWAAVRERMLQADAARRVRVAVGPEGGWTDAELARMGAAGFERVRISRQILRVETAAITAMSIVAAEFDTRPSPRP